MSDALANRAETDEVMSSDLDIEDFKPKEGMALVEDIFEDECDDENDDEEVIDTSDDVVDTTDEAMFKSHLEHVTYPDSFTVMLEGTIASFSDKNGDVKQMHICGPIVVTANVVHAASKKTGKEVTFLDRNNRLKTAIVWDSDLHASPANLSGSLADKGLWVDTTSKAHSQVARYLNTSEPVASKTYVDTAGWIDTDAFVLGSRKIGRSDIIIAENPVLDGAATVGTMEKWTGLIGEKCSGNPLLTFVVSLALSGPTFRMVEQTAHGIHLFGDSSSGKTTHARVAASVFGPGHTARGGFMQSWRATDNGLEFAFPARNDTLFILDEIGEASTDDVAKVAYMAANGRGKIRSTAKGGMQPVPDWRVPILSTGEMSMTDFLASGGRRTNKGQAIRLLSVPLCSNERDDDPFRDLHGLESAAEFARKLEDAAVHHGGHVGLAFVERLCAEYSESAERLVSIRAEFEARLDGARLDGLQSRVLHFFGAIAAAGTLACEFELLPLSKNEVFDATLEVFDRWREYNCDNLGTQENVLRKLQAILETHGRSRFAIRDGRNDFTPSGEAWGVWEEIEEYCWFASNAFKKVVLEGGDERNYYPILVRTGVVTPANNGDTTWRKKYPDLFPSGQVRFLKIDVERLAEVLNGDNSTITT